MLKVDFLVEIEELNYNAFLFEEAEDLDYKAILFVEVEDLDNKVVPFVEDEDLNSLYFGLDLLIELFLKFDFDIDYCTYLMTFIYYIFHLIYNIFSLKNLIFENNGINY